MLKESDYMYVTAVQQYTAEISSTAEKRYTAEVSRTAVHQYIA